MKEPWIGEERNIYYLREGFNRWSSLLTGGGSRDRLLICAHTHKSYFLRRSDSSDVADLYTQKKQGLPFLAIGLSKSAGFHPWNPYEIRRISPVKSVWNPADFTREIHMKSSGFHSWNPYEICRISWNLPDFTKSAGFHEIRRISWNVSFCVMIKYRSFFRKTKHIKHIAYFVQFDPLCRKIKIPWSSVNSVLQLCWIL